MHVRGCCIDFSPAIINEYLGIRKLITTDKVPPLKIISQETTSNVYEDWPRKICLPTACLSVKYSIINRIFVSSWAPTNHNSGITPSLDTLVYQISIKVVFDLGEYVFEKILKQVDSFIVKLPIYFPSLIYGVIINQIPDILSGEDMLVLVLAH